MLPDDPRHGTYAGAIAHWKAGQTCCGSCVLAARRMRKKNQLAKLSGKPGTVELGEAAINIISTTPRNQLVKATGYSHERLRRYEIAGPTKRVHRTTRDHILANAIPAWTPVGIQRRLRALAALGWSGKAVGDRIGSHGTTVNALRRRENPKHVRYPFAQRITALYEELCMTLPPTGSSATECRNEAVTKGWLPPLAWDDDTIDDPNANPMKSHTLGVKAIFDPVVVDRVLAGDTYLHTTPEEKREVVRRWKGSQYELAAITGWKVERYVVRNNEEGAA